MLVAPPTSAILVVIIVGLEMKTVLTVFQEPVTLALACNMKLDGPVHCQVIRTLLLSNPIAVMRKSFVAVKPYSEKITNANKMQNPLRFIACPFAMQTKSNKGSRAEASVKVQSFSSLEGQ